MLNHRACSLQYHLFVITIIFLSIYNSILYFLRQGKKIRVWTYFIKDFLCLSKCRVTCKRLLISMAYVQASCICILVYHIFFFSAIACLRSGSRIAKRNMMTFFNWGSSTSNCSRLTGNQILNSFAQCIHIDFIWSVIFLSTTCGKVQYCTILPRRCHKGTLING